MFLLLRILQKFLHKLIPTKIWQRIDMSVQGLPNLLWKRKLFNLFLIFPHLHFELIENFNLHQLHLLTNSSTNHAKLVRKINYNMPIKQNVHLYSIFFARRKIVGLKLFYAGIICKKNSALLSKGNNIGIGNASNYLLCPCCMHHFDNAFCTYLICKRKN